MSVLVVGCASGAVLLYEVEQADLVHQFSVHSAVTAMRWQYIELEGSVGWVGLGGGRREGSMGVGGVSEGD